MSIYEYIISTATLLGTLFGFIGILNLFMPKRFKRPNQLIYIPFETFSFSNLSYFGMNYCRYDRPFELKHKSKRINNRGVYFSGCLLCIGDDIESGDHTIEITLPEGFSWIDLTSYGSHRKIQSNIDVHKNKAILSFDGIRHNEFLNINAFVDSGNDKRLSNKMQNDISFSHRIKDTDQIEILECDDFGYDIRMDQLFKRLFIVSFFAFFSMFCCLTLINKMYSVPIVISLLVALILFIIKYYRIILEKESILRRLFYAKDISVEHI